MKGRVLQVAWACVIAASGIGCAKGGDDANGFEPTPSDAGDEWGQLPDSGQDVILTVDSSTQDVEVTCEADTQTSVGNCGSCGHVCDIPGAFAKCVAGECQIDTCAEGLWDNDGKSDNGCEYACTKTGEEACDNKDNDCDGAIDNGFDLQKDVNNCGSCGTVCEAANASSKCEGGVCKYTCDTGYSDLGSTGADGCFYKCPVSPAAIEICNGVDDDCDGQVDDGNPGAGQDCADVCPNKQCLGACKPGKTVCSGTASGLICTGGTGEAPELCDGIDNDCDGAIDDGFNLQSDPMNCGQCNLVCTSGSCVQGKCTCAAGYVDLNNDGACEYACPVLPPTTEVCDGVDQDCDGVVDDSPGDVGQGCDANCPAPAPCTANNSCAYAESSCSGLCCGVCKLGAIACVNGTKLCQGGGGPQLEICDGLDNNCDGQIDEGFVLASDPLNCGGCGNACNLAHAVSSCAASQCKIASCLPGFANMNNLGSDGCEYTCPVNPPTVESCNGKDDDCDGQVDEGLTAPGNFCNQVGPCAGSTPTCGGTKGWVCNYPVINPSIEVDAAGQLAIAETLCDGFDGNCNGQVDESFANKGKDCSTGSGACKGPGTFVCTADKKGTFCPAQPNPQAAVDEACNGIDDNCDGQVDERVPSGSPTCYNGGAHACKGWSDPMIKVGTNVWMYAYEASRPDATATDQGTGTSRACSAAGRLPWSNVGQLAAASACAAVKDSANNAMRLCTKAEWQTACLAGSTASPTWAYASAATVYAPNTCNGADHLLGQPWLTGGGVSCKTSTGLFDLSGNLAEWTSTATTVNGQQYFSVLGGAYNSTATGTSCNFDFVMQPQSFAYYDLGFRCCAGAAP